MLEEKITFDYSNVMSYLKEEQLEEISGKIKGLHNDLENKTAIGSEYTGWLDYPFRIKEELILDIEYTAQEIALTSDTFIVVGIGGSYLGAKAVIEALSHSFYNLQKKEARDNRPRIYFAGHNLCSSYLSDLMDIIKGERITLNVISKSGTTTETAIAFRILRNFMEKEYGKEETRKRIITTTDSYKGALHELSIREGYKTFAIPADIGGRYSVLTPVGLLPVAIAGIDIRRLLEGSKYMAEILRNPNIYENPAYMYAAVRNLLYDKGKEIEILACYEHNLHYFLEWWKQLFGESEGKNGRGLFPACADFTTDLHSLGQWIQEARRIIMETFLWVSRTEKALIIPEDEKDLDGLNYIAGKSLDYVNQKAMEATASAHLEGDVPNMLICIPEITPFYIGQLIYFFEKAAAMSGYVLGVNPFDQPGVEAYKRNMFSLMKKPGVEQYAEMLIPKPSSGGKYLI